METNENKTFAFPSDVYERAKAAKEAAFAFAADLKANPDPALKDLGDFTALEDLVAAQGSDVRLVLGLGRFNWNKGIWDFDAPPTRAVMARMTNLDTPERRRSVARDYLELHIKYDMLSLEDQKGFRRHTVMHNIYRGNYIFDEEVTDDAV